MHTGLCPVSSKPFKTKPHSIDWGSANRELAKLSPAERIRWAIDQFDKQIVLSTTFGPTAPALLKLATDILPNIPVVNVRHGYETSRTLELIDWYKDNLSLNSHTYRAPKLPVPAEDTPEFEEFKRKTKVEPFQRMLNELRPAVYLSGVMRWQSAYRRDLAFIENKGSVIAINPVLDMTKQQVDEFFSRTGLPRNRDYYDPAKGVRQDGECGCNTTIYT
jgi:phosphoadenosine phosphosulfate reductase